MADVTAKPVELPLEVPGHWSTLEGCRMANEYVGKERTDLTMGDMSDFALANGVYLAGRSDLDLIHYQQAAKERIRWLSARLAALSPGAAGII
jgi:hypothetical protein